MSIKIRKYEARDYEQVCDIFCDGVLWTTKLAIEQVLEGNNPKVVWSQGLIALILLIFSPK